MKGTTTLLLSLVWLGSPAAHAQENPAAPPPPRPAVDTKALDTAASLGDWPEFKRLLASMDPPAASGAYTRAVSRIAAACRSPRDHYQQRQPNQYPSNEQAPFRLIFVEDFHELVDAAPAKVPDRALRDLGVIARIVMDDTERAAFVERLRQGVKGIGGPTPEGRSHAVKFLTAAAWTKDAGTFLPLDRTQWPSADPGSLRASLIYLTEQGAERNDSSLERLGADLAFHLLRKEPGNRELLSSLTLLFARLPEADSISLARQLAAEPRVFSALLNDLADPSLPSRIIPPPAPRPGQPNAARQSQFDQDSALRKRLEAMISTNRKLLSMPELGLTPQMKAALVTVWLNQAEKTYRGNVLRSFSPGQRIDAVRTTADGGRLEAARKSLDREKILAHAPPREIIAALPASLRRRAELTLLKVKLMRPEYPSSIPLLENHVRDNPAMARELSEGFLTAWVAFRSRPLTDPEVQDLVAGGAPPVLLPVEGAIPLTRLQQKKNLADYSKLVADLRRISGGTLPAPLTVAGFMSIHGKAEVYRLEDIEAVFGPVERMDGGERAAILDSMAAFLKKEWREIKTQEQNGTRRTQKQMEDEVSRGYRTALEIAHKGIPDNAPWKELMTRARLYFDAAEYEYARSVKLSQYVDLRDGALASCRKAAESYARELPETPRSQWTVAPFSTWFSLMLGVSDLSKLTPAVVRSDASFADLGAAMDSLPGDAGAWHRLAFAKYISDGLADLPSNMRHIAIAAAIKAVGPGQPGLEAAEKALSDLRAILDEVELRVTPDHPPAVGTKEPFGLFISLLHTRHLARESGGFGRYLANSTGNGPKYRDNFMKYIREALSPSFEIISISLRDPGVKPIPLEREDWEETPLAYVFVRAKEASVDRIPSIQIDLTFNDNNGDTILPVVSQVESIDASSYSPPTSVPGLELTFSLDDRKWSQDGSVRTEIRAKARGPIPPAEDLFSVDQAGFEAVTKDEGLRVEGFTSDTSGRHPLMERSWLVSYTRKPTATGDMLFHFPTIRPGLETQSVSWQRFVDADVITLDAATAAKGSKLAGNTAAKRTHYGLWAAAAAILAATVVIVRRKLRAKKPSDVLDSGPKIPDPLTPFSAIAFLRHIASNPQSPLGDTQIRDIQADIHQIESSFFGKSPEENIRPDLAKITKKWAETPSRA